MSDNKTRGKDRADRQLDGKKPVMVRLRPDLFERLKRSSEQEQRSLGGQVAHILEEVLPEQAEV